MKPLVLIPTYNEAANIAEVIRGIRVVCPEAEILVADDDSPDRTWEIVEKLSAADPRVRILRRIGDRGRGRAGRDGFLWALKNGFDRVIEMDGDGSHPPEVLPRLLEASERYDAVIGSRYLPGGGSLRQGKHRDLISSLARRYLRAVLGVKVSDPTSGLRLFTASALEAIDVRSLRSRDPFIVTEVLYRCQRAGLRIGEVPFVFRDRLAGESKLGGGVLFKYLFRVLKLRFSGAGQNCN